MEYQIEVQIEGECAADADLLRRAALATLIQQDAPPTEVAIVIADDETLRELNHRYRGIDAPTDVLAFPNETRGPFVGVGGQPRYLGDVIVSWPRAAAQAAEAGHETLAELQLLVVHGVLHLLGMDDQEGAARARMWAAQETILSALEVEVNMPELDA
jgi:probable rRNA maturation factor